MTVCIPHTTREFYRLYQVQCLSADGIIRSTEKRLPALAVFERACAALARGTVIDTPCGPSAIEDLTPGDSVTTLAGAAPVTWIGSTMMTPRLPGACDSMLRSLVRVQATALRPNAPGDLIMGPMARIARRWPDARDRRHYSAQSPVDAFDGDCAFPIYPPSPVQMFQIQVNGGWPVSAHGLWIETLQRSNQIESRSEDWSLLAQLSVPVADRQGPGLVRSTP